MTSLLKRQFIEGRYKNILTQYQKFIGYRKPNLLNKVIPNLTENLRKSSQLFMEAIVNKDIDFIENTTSLALKNKLKAQFKSMGQNAYMKRVENKAYAQMLQKSGSNRNKILQQNGLFVTISPYVIFGVNITSKNNSENPWESLVPFLSTNRYIYMNPEETNINIVQQILKHQIFGFHCHFKDYKYQIQVYQNNQKIICPPKEFVITFQTDAENHDFVVADFNYFLKEKLI